MQNQLIHGLGMRHICAVVIVIHISNAIIMGFPPGVGNDSLFAYLFSAVFVLPLMLLYARLIHLMPGKDFFQMMEFAVGKAASIVLSVFMMIYFFMLAATVCNYYTQFLYRMALNKTPFIVILFGLFSVCNYLARSGAGVIGKWSSIIVFLSIVLTVLLVILSAPKYELRHVLPIMTHSLGEITLAEIKFLSFPVGQAVVVLSMAEDLDKKVNPYGALLFCGIFTILFFTVTYVKNCAVLGEKMMEIAGFSSYLAASVVEIGSIGTRIEAVVGIIFLLSGVTKAACSLYAAAKAAKGAFRLNSHKWILTPAGFFTVALSMIFFHSVLELYEFFSFYHIVSLPFQVGVPLIVWVAAEIKVKVNKLPVRAVWKEQEAGVAASPPAAPESAPG